MYEVEFNVKECIVSDSKFYGVQGSADRWVLQAALWRRECYIDVEVFNELESRIEITKKMRDP